MKRLGYLIHIFMLSIYSLHAKVQVNFDEHLSDVAKQCVYEKVDEAKLAQNKLAQSAHSMQQCPAIKDVSIARPNPEDMEVCVASSQPHAIVNEKYVLTHDGEILDAKLYENSDHLPAVQTRKSDSELSSKCKKFLLAMPHELLAAYDVDWKDGANVVLYDKKQPFFTVTCSIISPPNALQYEACEKIKQELVDRGQLGDAPIEAWDADIRFDKQIIVSRK